MLPNGKPAPVMFLMSGPRTGERLYLRHGFTIGKAPTCDLVIDDGFTSSVHAQIGMDTFGNCRLYDNNSTNGVYVQWRTRIRVRAVARREPEDRLDRDAFLGTMRTHPR